MALPQGFLDSLLERVSLESVVSKHVKLTKRGNRLVGLCPFHKEKTPSFYVSEDKGLYHCFGCKASGDAIAFLRETENLDFMEAVKQLAHSVGMQLPDTKPIPPEEVAWQDKLKAMLTEAADFYRTTLSGDKGAKARNYLARRGIDETHINLYGLGYAPSTGLLAHLKTRGHSQAEVIKAGLARKHEDKDSVYDYFYDRLMFAISDSRGQIVGFGGRALADRQNPKYLNSADSPLFHKRHLLYGLPQAQQRLQSRQPCLIVEGYMDVIAIQQMTDMAAVAPLGTALTEEQIQSLWRRHDSPYLCFDGDAAGQAAANAALLRILPHMTTGKTLRLVRLPKDQDPDALLRGEDKAVFAKAIENSLGFVEAFWQAQASAYDLSDPSARAQFWETIRRHVKDIKHNTMRTAIGDEINWRIQKMRDEYRHHQGTGKFTHKGRGDGFMPIAMPVRPEDAQVKKNNKPRQILALLIEHPELYAEYCEEIGTVGFDDAMAKKTWQIMEKHATSEGLDKTQLHTILQEAGIIHAGGEGNVLLDSIIGQLRYHPAEIDMGEASKRICEAIKAETKRITSIDKRRRTHNGA